MTRRGPIIAAAVSVVVVILAVVFLLLPKMNEVKEVKKDVTDAQSVEQSLRAQLTSLQEAQANAPKFNKQIAKIDTQLPPTADLPGLLRMLRGAADSSAVDFFTVSPGTPTLSASGAFSTVPTTITVTGSYFSVEEFLFRLEKLPRVGKVTSIAISSQQSETGALTLSTQLTAEFYTSDTSAGPGSEPGPSGSTSSSSTSSGSAT
ncbi:MAG TPA: type 4a pilus biogenesis protein PilO [Actinomycetota bacterium]